MKKGLPMKKRLLFVLAAAAAAASAMAEPLPPALPPRAAPPGYAIGLADVLRVVVWKEPDLTLDVTVRPDGMITVPLLGDVVAAGRAPGQLAAALVEGLGEFVESPRVTVSVTQASARIAVMGEVLRPGEFPLSGRMTVLNALALAGGFREFAKPDAVVIIREDQTVVPFNYRRVVEGRDVAQNIRLAPGDTVVVP